MRRQHSTSLVVSFALGFALVIGAASSCTGVERSGEGEGEVPTGEVCEVGDFTIPKPGEAAVRVDGAAVNLGCVGAPVVLEQSAAVRMQGCIDVFGVGGRATAGIRVAVFDEAQDPGPSGEAPAYGEVLIGVVEDAVGLDCAGADANTAACLALSCPLQGAYVVGGVPTGVPLTIKVYTPGDDSVIVTYTYGVVLGHLGNAIADGVATYDASIIYRSTYDIIPVLGGRLIEGAGNIGDGVGRGVVAGEVRDCDDVVVQGASVTSDQKDATTKITYFNGDEANPEPEQTRLTTNEDGLYVVLNATSDAGTDVHTVAAGILDPGCSGEDCQCLSMSTRTVRVFPDSVSIATLRGDLPVLE